MTSALGPGSALGPDTVEADATDTARPAVPAGRCRAFHRLRPWWPEVLLAGLLSLATFVVHNVGYMFSAPFWNDEAWVGDLDQAAAAPDRPGLGEHAG